MAKTIEELNAEIAEYLEVNRGRDHQFLNQWAIVFHAIDLDQSTHHSYGIAAYPNTSAPHTVEGLFAKGSEISIDVAYEGRMGDEDDDD